MSYRNLTKHGVNGINHLICKNLLILCFVVDILDKNNPMETLKEDLEGDCGIIQVS